MAFQEFHLICRFLVCTALAKVKPGSPQLLLALQMLILIRTKISQFSEYFV